MEKYLGYSGYLRECLNIKKDDLNHSGNQTNHLRHESSHPVFLFKNLPVKTFYPQAIKMPNLKVCTN